MEKHHPQTIDEIINSLNKDQLLDHFKRLLILFKRRLRKLEYDGNNQITNYALKAILKILANTGEKFPYMIDIDVGREGNIIGVNLRENPFYKWPFEVYASRTKDNYEENKKQADSSGFPYIIDTENNNGGYLIKFINPISNPPLAHTDSKDQSFLKSLSLIASYYFKTNPEKETTKLVITGSRDGQLVFGLSNRRYFADPKIKNQPPIFSL